MKLLKFLFLSILISSFISCSEKEELSEINTIATDQIANRTTSEAERACQRFTHTPYRLLLCERNGGDVEVGQLNHEATSENIICNISFTPQSINVIDGLYQLDIVSTPTNDVNELFNTSIAVLEQSLRSNDNLPGNTTVPLGTLHQFEYNETRTYWYIAVVGTPAEIGTLTADVIGPCPQLFGAQIGDFLAIGLNNIPTFSFTCSVGC